jgi:hypothetical protein
MGKPGRADIDLKWLNDEDYGPDPAPPSDPTRALRRLAAGILLQAIEDMRFWNPHVRRDALLFLLPRDQYFREHLELVLTVSRTDQRAFRRYMSRFF